MIKIKRLIAWRYLRPFGPSGETEGPEATAVREHRTVMSLGLAIPT
jgi:hypothetical protein